MEKEVIKQCVTAITILAVIVAVMTTGPVGIAKADHTEGGVHVESSTDSVDQDGNTGSQETNDGDSVYGTIQAAIDDASAGQTIQVASGTYSEHVVIDKSVTISGDRSSTSRGPGSNAPILDGEGQVMNAIDISEGVSFVTIEGFEIRNYSYADNSGGRAIAAGNNGTSDVLIRDVYIHNVGWHGIEAANVGQGTHENWTVTNSIIEDFVSFGVRLANVDNATVRDNTVRGQKGVTQGSTDGNRSDNGIFIEAKVNQETGSAVELAVSTATVTDNDVIGPFDGSGIEASSWNSQGGESVRLSDITISDNSVNDVSNYGLAIGSRGSTAQISNVTATENTVTNSNRGGIVWAISGATRTSATINNNKFTENNRSVRFFLQSTPGLVTVINNTLKNNTVGLSVADNTSASGVTTSDNDIIENYEYGAENHANEQLNATHNWWGADAGPFHAESNPDGTGDPVSDNVNFDPWLASDGSSKSDEIPNGSITFDDKSVATGTSSIRVDTATANVRYYVNISRGATGIGHSDDITANTNDSVTVSLDSAITENQTLTASVHDASDDAELASDDASITITKEVFTNPIPGTGANQAPTDTDGDGKTDDVNGDGEKNFDDAVSLAFANTSGLNQEQKDALDFDGDGDVDFNDAVALAFL